MTVWDVTLCTSVSLYGCHSNISECITAMMFNPHAKKKKKKKKVFITGSVGCACVKVSLTTQCLKAGTVLVWQPLYMVKVRVTVLVWQPLYMVKVRVTVLVWQPLYMVKVLW